MSTKKKVESKKVKSDEKSSKPQLTFRVISNTRVQGPAPKDDRFTLSKSGLLFNVQTRRKLNIPVPAYVEFCAANEEGYEKVVFLRFHKTRMTDKCMKVGKMGNKYYKIPVPTSAAKEVGMVFKALQGKNKRKRSAVHYKGESYRMSEKRRMLMLTPVEAE